MIAFLILVVVVAIAVYVAQDEISAARGERGHTSKDDSNFIKALGQLMLSVLAIFILFSGTKYILSVQQDQRELADVKQVTYVKPIIGDGYYLQYMGEVYKTEKYGTHKITIESMDGTQTRTMTLRHIDYPTVDNNGQKLKFYPYMKYKVLNVEQIDYVFEEK